MSPDVSQRFQVFRCEAHNRSFFLAVSACSIYSIASVQAQDIVVYIVADILFFFRGWGLVSSGRPRARLQKMCCTRALNIFCTSMENCKATRLNVVCLRFFPRSNYQRSEELGFHCPEAWMLSSYVTMFTGTLSSAQEATCCRPCTRRITIDMYLHIKRNNQQTGSLNQYGREYYGIKKILLETCWSIR